MFGMDNHMFQEMPRLPMLELKKGPHKHSERKDERNEFFPPHPDKRGSLQANKHLIYRLKKKNRKKK